MDEQDILALDLNGLTAAIEDHSNRLDAALAVETPTAEQVAEAEALDQSLSALQAEMDRRNEAAAALQEMRDRQAERAAARAAQQASSQPEEDEEEESEEEPEDEEQEEEQEESVTASAPRGSALRALGGRTATPREQDTGSDRTVTITAAAEVPRLATGATIPDMSRVAEALIDRAAGFPQFSGGREGGQLHRFAVANFGKPFEDELTVDNRMGNQAQLEVLDRAGNESRVGESLVAAGGWCIPSELLLDLCEGASTDGLFDLPEVQVRGGLRYTRGPDFSALYEAGFTQTEAQAIAGTTKTCYEIPCPEFEEVRLDAIGICVKVPLLTNAAWPELVQRYLSEAMVAHQHRVSNYLITKAVAEAGAAVDLTGTFNTGSAAGSILSAVEFLIDRKRDSYRLAESTTMEAVFPSWVRAAMRADLAHRNGVDMMNVSDQQLNSWFAARKARPQFIRNWQPIAADALGYPAEVQALIYPAGTFIRGSASVISLDAVYDAASLSVNEYTGLFFEEGILLATRCYTPSLVTLPVCASGRTGAADNVACLTVEETPEPPETP